MIIDNDNWQWLLIIITANNNWKNRSFSIISFPIKTLINFQMRTSFIGRKLCTLFSNQSIKCYCIAHINMKQLDKSKRRVLFCLGLDLTLFLVKNLAHLLFNHKELHGIDELHSLHALIVDSWISRCVFSNYYCFVFIKMILSYVCDLIP